MRAAIIVIGLGLAICVDAVATDISYRDVIEAPPLPGRSEGRGLQLLADGSMLVSAVSRARGQVLFKFDRTGQELWRWQGPPGRAISLSSYPFVLLSDGSVAIAALHRDSFRVHIIDAKGIEVSSFPIGSNFGGVNGAAIELADGYALRGGLLGSPDRLWTFDLDGVVRDAYTLVAEPPLSQGRQMVNADALVDGGFALIERLNTGYPESSKDQIRKLDAQLGIEWTQDFSALANVGIEIHSTLGMPMDALLAAGGRISAAGQSQPFLSLLDSDGEMLWAASGPMQAGLVYSMQAYPSGNEFHFLGAVRDESSASCVLQGVVSPGAESISAQCDEVAPGLALHPFARRSGPDSAALLMVGFSQEGARAYEVRKALSAPASVREHVVPEVPDFGFHFGSLGETGAAALLRASWSGSQDRARLVRWGEGLEPEMVVPLPSEDVRHFVSAVLALPQGALFTLDTQGRTHLVRARADGEIEWDLEFDVGSGQTVATPDGSFLHVASGPWSRVASISPGGSLSWLRELDVTFAGRIEATADGSALVGYSGSPDNTCRVRRLDPDDGSTAMDVSLDTEGQVSDSATLEDGSTVWICRASFTAEQHVRLDPDFAPSPVDRAGCELASSQLAAIDAGRWLALGRADAPGAVRFCVFTASGLQASAEVTLEGYVSWKREWLHVDRAAGVAHLTLHRSEEGGDAIEHLAYDVAANAIRQATRPGLLQDEHLVSVSPPDARGRIVTTFAPDNPGVESGPRLEYGTPGRAPRFGRDVSGYVTMLGDTALVGFEPVGDFDHVVFRLARLHSDTIFDSGFE